MLPMPCAKREGRQNGARTVRGVHAQRTRIMLRSIAMLSGLSAGEALTASGIKLLRQFWSVAAEK